MFQTSIDNGRISKVYVLNPGIGYCQGNYSSVVVNPSYVVYADKYSVFEGSSVTFTVQTENVPDGNKVSWYIGGDVDQDGCDDCTNGSNDSLNDGFDLDNDGICNTDEVGGCMDPEAFNYNPNATTPFTLIESLFIKCLRISADEFGVPANKIFINSFKFCYILLKACFLPYLFLMHLCSQPLICHQDDLSRVEYILLKGHLECLYALFR